MNDHCQLLENFVKIDKTKVRTYSMDWIKYTFTIFFIAISFALTQSQKTKVPQTKAPQGFQTGLSDFSLGLGTITQQVGDTVQKLRCDRIL